MSELGNFARDVQRQAKDLKASLTDGRLAAGVNQAASSMQREVGAAVSQVASSDVARQVREIHQDIKSGALGRGIKEAARSTKEAIVNDQNFRKIPGKVQETANLYMPFSEQMRGINREEMVQNIVANFIDQPGVWTNVNNESFARPDEEVAVEWSYRSNALTGKKIILLGDYTMTRAEELAQARELIQDAIDEGRVSRGDTQKIVDAEIAVLTDLETRHANNDPNIDRFTLGLQARNTLELLNVWGGNLQRVEARDLASAGEFPDRGAWLAQHFLTVEELKAQHQDQIVGYLMNHPVLLTAARDQGFDLYDILKFGRQGKNIATVLGVAELELKNILDILKDVHGVEKNLTDDQRENALDSLNFLEDLGDVGGLAVSQQQNTIAKIAERYTFEPQEAEFHPPSIIEAPANNAPTAELDHFREVVEGALQVLDEFRDLTDEWALPSTQTPRKKDIADILRGNGKSLTEPADIALFEQLNEKVKRNDGKIKWAVRQAQEALRTVRAYKICYGEEEELQGKSEKEIIPLINMDRLGLGFWYETFSGTQDKNKVDPVPFIPTEAV